MKFLQRKRRNQRDDQRRPTRTHGSRDRAEWRNCNDAIACLTRMRGLESAQMTRARGRRGRVTCMICKKIQMTLVTISGLFLTQFPAQKIHIRSCRMDKSSGPHPSTEDLLINSNLNSNLIF
ncbi:Retrotransposon gag protein [Arachis hypogaea]|nr:Retrotransposon gag protein [Arachis hypogaea]